MRRKIQIPHTLAEVDLSYYLTFVSGEDPSVMEKPERKRTVRNEPDRKTAVLLRADSIGDEKSVGRPLMKEFLNSLRFAKRIPGTLILMNSAVRLAESSGSSFCISELERAGVRIIVCMTSAEAYGITSMSAGYPASMDEIVSALSEASKIITI